MSSSSDGDGAPPKGPLPSTTLVGLPNREATAASRRSLPPPQRSPYSPPPAGSPSPYAPPSAPPPTTPPADAMPTMPSGPQTTPYGVPEPATYAATTPTSAPPMSGPTAVPPQPSPYAPPPVGSPLPSSSRYTPIPSPLQPDASRDDFKPLTLLTRFASSDFVKFLKISSRRAFRLRIEPSEVLHSERAALESASPPIVDPNLQAFLAWRRSVLFLVASALIPLTIFGILGAIVSSKTAMPIRLVKLAPALAEGVFAIICWMQLKRWAHWRSQRRALFFGWLLFMLTPFVVFLYPLRSVFSDAIGSNVADMAALGFDMTKARGLYNSAVQPFVFAMLAMLQLAPKAISLMPGLIRSSLVIKLLFPGSTAPGWLIVMCAPIYALLAYVILVIPYQFTGSGWFIAGVLGVIVGQGFLARSGFALAQPLSESDALVHINRVRKYYMSVMAGSAVLIVIALGSLVSKLNLSWTDVLTAVLKFETNVLILTMIGADLVITNLDRARTQTLGKDAVEELAEAKIAAFVSLDAPHVPPPPGPAAW